MLVEIGTQDLGTGTRTIITQVAAETLGLQMGQVKLAIGSNELPRDAASGGSTTVGGVSVSTRRSSMNALAKLFEAAAPALGAEPDQLEAVDGHIRVKGSPNKSLAWATACKKIGAGKISEMGEFNSRQRAPGMNDQGVGGVQIADVSVDTETGIVKVNRYVAVQDCGLIINPRLAESQVYGAIIMGISTALFEQRVMDEQTGRMLNPEMEFYKLAGIGDIPEIVGAPGYPGGKRQARRDRAGRAAGGADLRRHRQRRGQCHRRAGAQYAHVARSRTRRSCGEDCVTCNPSNMPIRQAFRKLWACCRPGGARPTFWPAAPTRSAS